MIEEIEQIMTDCFSIRVPSNQLHQAAVEIDKLYTARFLPIEQDLVQLIRELTKFRDEMLDE